MEDLKYIQDNYAQLDDVNLLTLWNEKYKLRTDVIDLLRKELNKRKLIYTEDQDNFIENDTENIETSNNHQQNEKEINTKNNIKEKVIYYKEQGYSNQSLIKELTEKYNVNPDMISEILKEQKSKGNKSIIYGIITAFIAIFRIFSVMNGRSTIPLWDTIYIIVFSISSILLIFSGLKNKQLYK